MAYAQVGYGDSTSRPNIVLIMTDDQGYGDLSLNGNPHLQTPHIDGLAASGVRFERFYVNSFCAPTRAALLTGRYPLRCGVFGVTHNKECMRAEEVTIADAFREAGYRTTCIGKWHNGEQYPYTPPGHGFDEFFGFHNGHINNYFNGNLFRGAQPVPTQGYITDVLTDEALRFIEANSDRPFFCYVAYNAPHSPYQVPDSYYDDFRERGFSESVSAFWGMCENIDDNVGRMLALLDERGLAEETIVVFLTDNGGTAGVKIYNAGMRGGKTSVHEGGCRVPLLIRWPARFSQPHTVTQITSHIDLYPTLLEMCEIPQPDGPPIDGTSLLPLMVGDDDDWPDRVLFTHNPISEDNRYPGAVRTQQYRLVREVVGRQGGSSAKPTDPKDWQLYDMQADPGEKSDLAATQPQRVAELSRLYEAWIDDLQQRKPARLPIPVGHAEENPVTLNAPQAYPSAGLTFANGPGFAHDWLTGWTGADDSIRFDVDVQREGAYHLELIYGCASKESAAKLRISADDNAFEVVIAPAEAPIILLPHRDERGKSRYVNRDWSTAELGRLELPRGRVDLTISTIEIAPGAMIDFKGLSLEFVGTDSPAD